MGSLHRSASASNEILNSWKEIAAYLDRGVRTVQRWEADLHLPVRRPSGRGRSAVIAMRGEIDAWLRACPLEKRQKHLTTDENSALFCQELLNVTRRLRTEVFRSSRELSIALQELSITVQKMTAAPSFNTQARVAHASDDHHIT
ncbi:MAG TPA: hypothetical protein VKT33_00740 [Candidatus Angelobacter sp.]|nr:hypothetical protein [Candidatus Angelobacter sp.]